MPKKSPKVPQVTVKITRNGSYFTATILGLADKVGDVTKLISELTACEWVYNASKRGRNIVFDHMSVSVSKLEAFLTGVLAAFGVEVKPIAR